MRHFEKFHDSNALADISRRLRETSAAAMPVAAPTSGGSAAIMQIDSAAQQLSRQPEDDAAPLSVKKRKAKRKSAGMQHAQTAEQATAELDDHGAELPGLHAAPVPQADTSAEQRSNDEDGSTFREVYLSSFLSAFGDDLQTFRSNSAGRGAERTDLLLQCIGRFCEASMETFSDAQQAACLQHVQTQRRQAAGQPVVQTLATNAWL